MASHCWETTENTSMIFPEMNATQQMMLSSNGNIFHITSLLWGEYTGHWLILLTKAIDTELWCLVEQTSETLLICDAIMLIIMSL